jgi:hypothetical protein
LSEELSYEPADPLKTRKARAPGKQAKASSKNR